LEQAAHYNTALHAPWLLLTNGAEVRVFRRGQNGSFLPDSLRTFAEMTKL
jgi:hypothetical protein